MKPRTSAGEKSNQSSGSSPAFRQARSSSTPDRAAPPSPATAAGGVPDPRAFAIRRYPSSPERATTAAERSRSSVSSSFPAQKTTGFPPPRRAARALMKPALSVGAAKPRAAKASKVQAISKWSTRRGRARGFPFFDTDQTRAWGTVPASSAGIGAKAAEALSSSFPDRAKTRSGEKNRSNASASLPGSAAATLKRIPAPERTSPMARVSRSSSPTTSAESGVAATKAAQAAAHETKIPSTIPAATSRFLRVPMGAVYGRPLRGVNERMQRP